MYVLDFDNRLVRKVAANGQVSTVTGFVAPLSLTNDPSGNMYVVDGADVVRIAADGTRTKVRSYQQTPGSYKPVKVVSDKQGRLYVTMNYRNAWYIQRINLDGLAAADDATVYSVSTWGQLNDLALNSQSDLAASVNQPTTQPTQKVYFIPKSIQPASQNFVASSPSIPDTPGILTLTTSSDSEQAIAYDGEGDLYVLGFARTVASDGTHGTTSDMHLTRIAPDGTTTTLMRGFPDGSTTPYQRLVNGSVALTVNASGDIYFSFDQAVYRRATSGQITLLAGKPGESGNSD